MKVADAEDIEKLRATREVMAQTSAEIHQLEAQANRILLKLRERPIRGLGR